MNARFGGIFDPARPGRGGLISRSFAWTKGSRPEHQLLDFVEEMSRRAQRRNHVFLCAIQLDVEQSRYPDLLCRYFSDDWRYEDRYCTWPICKVTTEAKYEVGRLTFEARPGRLSKLLALGHGVRFGAGLLVGGIQVAEEHVREAIRLFPFDPADSVGLEPMAQLGWAATEQLYDISVWVPPSRLDLQTYISSISS